MKRYKRTQIDTFCTWHLSASVDINIKTGDLFAIYDVGLFKYHRHNDKYTKFPAIALLKTGLGAACVSVNENTGDVAVVHKNGINVYEPSGNRYEETVLEVFEGIIARGRCAFHKASGDIFVVNDASGFYLYHKTTDGYQKLLIDNFGLWYSNSGIAINQKTGDVFLVTNHVGGGPGPYPVDSSSPAHDDWPKGDCLVRYRPTGDGHYMKMIVDWPVATLGGADLDVNSATGEVILIADPSLYIYKPEGDKYAKATLGATLSRGEGVAVKVNEETGDIVEVANGQVQILKSNNQGVSIDAAMTRNCGVDVTINPTTGEVIMIDNRGLVIYEEPPAD